VNSQFSLKKSKISARTYVPTNIQPLECLTDSRFILFHTKLFFLFPSSHAIYLHLLSSSFALTRSIYSRRVFFTLLLAYSVLISFLRLFIICHSVFLYIFPVCVFVLERRLDMLPGYLTTELCSLRSKEGTYVPLHLHFFNTFFRLTLTSILLS
jgi:hypothetical protein